MSDVLSVMSCRTNGPLIAAAGRLYIDDADLVVDVTYGLGRFWSHYQPRRFVAHDIDPAKGDGVDFRHLPYGDGQVDVVVFDPPYIAQGGRATSTIPEMLDRFGLIDVPKSVKELEALIADGINESSRVLAPSGRLFVKCMDYINGGRLVKGRHHVVATAEAAGLEQIDEFIHASGTGPQPPGRSQIHSRRAHSFLCVFQKAPVWRKSAAREVARRRVTPAPQEATA